MGLGVELLVMVVLVFRAISSSDDIIALRLFAVCGSRGCCSGVHVSLCTLRPRMMNLSMWSYSDVDDPIHLSPIPIQSSKASSYHAGLGN